MTDDLIRDLSRIQNQAAGLAELINNAQDSAPRTTTAADGSGMITMTLGPNGLPKTFQVDRDWQRRIDPARLGPAVLEAFEVAMNERLATWSRTLQDQGWQDDVDRLRSGSSDSTAGRVPPAFRRPQPAAHPRSIDIVAEEMIRALDRTDDIAAAQQQTGTGTGSDRSGKVTLTLSPSALVSCVVDAQWAADQSGTTLTNALIEALGAASADLTRERTSTATGPDLNSLFGEALGLLNDPRRMLDT